MTYPPNSQPYQPPSLNHLEVEEMLMTFSDREIKWAADYLNKKRRNFSSEPDLNNLLGYVKEFLMRLDPSIGQFEFSHIVKARATLLVPQENFNWLNEDIRAQGFTWLYLWLSYEVFPNKFYENSYIDLIYCFIDTFTPLVRKGGQQNEPITTTNDKLVILRDVKDKWENIVGNCDFEKWIDKQDENILDWMYDYLSIRTPIIKIAGPAEEAGHKKVLILLSLYFFDWSQHHASFQGWETAPSGKKLIFIDKIKRAWSQQKYRAAGKTKSKYHLPLTKQTHRRLAKMAQVKGLSETAILDILINRFYEIDCVDIDGKDLY